MNRSNVFQYRTLSEPSRRTGLFLTRKRLFDVIDDCEYKNNWLALNSLLECVYSSKDNLADSFLQGSDDDVADDKSECEDTEKGFKVLPGVYYTTDIVSLRRAYDRLFNLDPINFFPGIKNGLVQLALSFRRAQNMSSTSAATIDNPQQIMNMLIVIIEIPFLGDMQRFEEVLPSVCQIIGSLNITQRSIFSEVLAKTMRDSVVDEDSLVVAMPNKLVKLHQTLQQQLTLRLLIRDYNNSFSLHLDPEVINTVVTLECVFYSSILAGKVDSAQQLEKERSYHMEHDLHQYSATLNWKFSNAQLISTRLYITAMDCRKPLIPYDDFINDTLNKNLDVTQDFDYFKASREISFTNYSFLLNTHIKTKHLFYENRMQMRPFVSRENGANSPLISPALKLSVDRNNLVSGTLNQLERKIELYPEVLKRRLYIDFDNEETIDDGGVSKEFFQLITEQMFNPDYGMFVLDLSKTILWFNPFTVAPMTREFRLIGIVLGLAMYNNVILDLKFPPVLYRKLMGKLGNFDDLQTLDPVMYSSLNNMLNCTSESELEDVYAQNFEISLQDSFGNVINKELKKDGKDIPVTLDNKEEFVDLYADFLLNDSIMEHFNAFFLGFHMVVNQTPLKLLFRPDELELILCGSKKFDFKELERSTKYDGGFNARSRVIQDFWYVVQHEMSVEEHSKLLKFVTGSDRIPIGGMQNMEFVILRGGPDTDKLPTAQTCYNTLLLPEYSSRAKMQRLLLKAINYSTGFGIL